MTDNPLSGLKLDYWYKLLPLLGTITLIIGLTVDVKGVANSFVQLVSLGVIFVGIGEWINHPLQVRIAPGIKITSYNRKNTFAGNAWNLFGVTFIGYAIYKYLI
jgi:hypothetical protein